MQLCYEINVYFLLNVILVFSLVDVLLAFREGQQNSLELDLIFFLTRALKYLLIYVKFHRFSG